MRFIRIAYGTVQGYKREMSQAEIARLCGINRQAWNNAETGDSRLGLDNAMALSRQTGVTLDYLFFGNRAGLPHLIAVEIERLEREEGTKKRA
jgi:transcriptional regulator with XRE-family HTH domain